MLIFYQYFFLKKKTYMIYISFSIIRVKLHFFFFFFFLVPLIYSRRVVVSYKRKYVHKLLVNRSLKPAQEKVWLSELTVPQ